MAQFSSDPSMEDILASIKRIIAEDAPAPSPPTVRTARVPRRDEVPTLELEDEAPPEEDVLELTRPIGPTLARGSVGDSVGDRAATPDLISNVAADASRSALAALSSVAGQGGAGGNALEGLVRELLRPMLRDWLDANLPAVVERLVASEIARISGR